MTTTATCPICAESVGEPNVANCYNCRRDFHLQMRMDVDGKDCGLVWLHEERMHLMFGCNECIGAGVFEGVAPPAEGA